MKKNVITAIIILLVAAMTAGRERYDLKPYTDLTDVSDIELLDLDWKRAETEGVKLDANYPKLHRGSDIGVLIIHGFTASPLEMQPAADFLKEMGFTTYQVRVIGHGSEPANLNATTYKDWYESARYGYFLLKRNCKRVFVMGSSMGGLAALTVAGLNGADGVILLAPCIKIRSAGAYLTPFLKNIIKFIPKVEAGEWSKEMTDIYYGNWPVRGLYELFIFTKYIKENMEMFDFPLLGFQFANDMVVSGKATSGFFDKVPSDDKTYVEFPNKKMTNHILVSEKNIYRDKMFARILEWLNEKSR